VRDVRPALFLLRKDDGHSFLADEDVAPENEAHVRKAAASCPEQAIVFVDE
jgi:ferredoxin